MSSFNEAAKAEIEELFGRVRQGRFVTTQQAVTPYEDPIGPGQINPQGFLADGAISNIDIFTGLIRPPVVVTSLPALPDDSYPVGSFAFLTTDAKLYRNTDGSTWSATVASGDITGHVGIPIAASDPTLPDATYPVGSFYFNSTDKHLRKTIDGTTWILAVDAGDIVANSITAGQIAAGTITSTEIAALTIQAGDIAANTITAGQIAAGTITATELAALSVTASKLNIVDDNGATALTGSGFAGSWLRFIGDGLYNSVFASGTLGALTYGAAPSSELPFWGFYTHSGALVTATLTSASAAPGGQVVRIAAGSATGATTYGYIRQLEVPASAGRYTMIRVAWRNDNASVSLPVRIRAAFLFRDVDGNDIGASLYDSVERTASDSAGVYTWDFMSVLAPAGAHHGYVRIGPLWNVGADASATVDIAQVVCLTDVRDFLEVNVGSTELSEYTTGTLKIEPAASGNATLRLVAPGANDAVVQAYRNSESYSRAQIGTFGGVGAVRLGGGAADVDVWARRSAAKTITLDTDGAGGALTSVIVKGKVEGTGVAGATISASESTGQAFEVKQDTSGADAYIAFHVAGDYAGMFGLDGSTNDLFWGGWSVGAQYKVFHAGNHYATTVSESRPTTDVTMTTANTQYDSGASLSLAAGTYLLYGHIGFKSGAGACYVNGRLISGSTVIDEPNHYLVGGGYACSLPVVGTVVLTGTTTVKISAIANANAAVILADAPTNATADKSTVLMAVRIA